MVNLIWTRSRLAEISIFKMFLKWKFWVWDQSTTWFEIGKVCSVQKNLSKETKIHWLGCMDDYVMLTLKGKYVPLKLYSTCCRAEFWTSFEILVEKCVWEIENHQFAHILCNKKNVWDLKFRKKLIHKSATKYFLKKLRKRTAIHLQILSKNQKTRW